MPKYCSHFTDTLKSTVKISYGKDTKNKYFILVLKVCREFDDVTSAGKLLHVRAATTQLYFAGNGSKMPAKQKGQKNYKYIQLFWLPPLSTDLYILQSCVKYSTSKNQCQCQYQWSKHQYQYQWSKYEYQYQY